VPADRAEITRRGFGRALAAVGLSLGAFGEGTARAGSLTDSERETLQRGGVVRRNVDVELEEGTYIGGVAYAMVKVPAPFVLDMMRDVSTYKLILPMTLEARQTGQKGGDKLVYFKHGDATTAAYTMRVRDADSEGVIRFWMDPALEHEIEDVWGYLRIEALGPETCLATYAVLCDLGLILRVTLGDEIRRYALDTPGNLKRVAEGRHFGAQFHGER
jgi:hypothetical protein